MFLDNGTADSCKYIVFRNTPCTYAHKLHVSNLAGLPIVLGSSFQGLLCREFCLLSHLNHSCQGMTMQRWIQTVRTSVVKRQRVFS